MSHAQMYGTWRYLFVPQGFATARAVGVRTFAQLTARLYRSASLE
jgi:hypothetical protein